MANIDDRDVAEIGRELLHGEAPEAGAESSAPYRAGEVLAVLLEGGGVERLAIVAGQAELDGAQATPVDAQAQPLNDEGRLVGKPAVGLEPVALALTDVEPAPLGCAREGEQEEAERRRIHDLRALVVDPALAIHAPINPASAHEDPGTIGLRRS